MCSHACPHSLLYSCTYAVSKLGISWGQDILDHRYLLSPYHAPGPVPDAGVPGPCQGARNLAVVQPAVTRGQEKDIEMSEEDKVPALVDLEFHLGTQAADK